jgi:hypothetical protein
MADLSYLFVRLLGMIFDRINLEQYEEVANTAFRVLSKALLGACQSLGLEWPILNPRRGVRAHQIVQHNKLSGVYECRALGKESASRSTPGTTL